MEERLKQLREEFRRGTEEMARLDSRRHELTRTLLRISGAIQVLEELCVQHGTPSAAPTPEGTPSINVVGG
jgi:hypothetical protein